MSDALNLNSFTVVLPNAMASNDLVWLMKAPTAAQGGGVSLEAINIVNWPASEDQTSSTAFTLQFLKYSSEGTPALNGTIGATLGGTTAPFLKAIPQSVTITTSFLDAGEWLVAKYVEQNATNPTNCTIQVKYLMGK